MTMRIAILGDIHGNVRALEAVMAQVEAARPDALAITGDLVMNGPRPREVVQWVKRLDAAGAYVVQGNTDIAVADFDYSAAFPWLDDVPAGHRAAAEWAHDALGDDELRYLRRLPAERRIHAEDVMVLVCHASPGSQTSGFSPDLDAGVVVERLARTDARGIVCGHTHVAAVKDFGRKLVCNPGSCGYALDGDPDAAWAMLTVDGSDVQAELHRAPYDRQQVSDELSERGLTGDVARAWTVYNGKQRQ
jgi:putative phosphoesterase